MAGEGVVVQRQIPAGEDASPAATSLSRISDTDSSPVTAGTDTSLYDVGDVHFRKVTRT
jgi:hypothetical protein